MISESILLKSSINEVISSSTLCKTAKDFEKYLLPKLFLLSLVFCLLSTNLLLAQEVSDPLLLQVEQLQKANEEKINAAFGAMEAVQEAGAYIESLSELLTNGVITLPVGIKKGEYELIIQKLSYDKNTDKTSIYATCAFKFKDNGQKIAFEGSAVLEGQKGLGTQGYLEVIAPIRRNLGQQAALVFNTGTRANFGCEGIESYKVRLDLIITSDKLIAIDDNGQETNKAIKTSFDATFFDFENFTVSFGFDNAFMFKGLKDIVFNIQGATLDQSDLETSAMVQFPTNYFTGSVAEEAKLWKGIYITDASIALPAIFRNNYGDTTNQDSSTTISSVSPDRFVLGLNNVLIDENGFTGNTYANDVIVSELLDQDKWDISLTDFSIELMKNELSGFGFGGDLNIPPLGNNSMVPYAATFNFSTEEYEFQAGISGKYDFPVLRSSLSLNETSTIEILFRDADIYPTINASGFISVDAPINKADSTKKFTLPDVTFENMKISREDPYFSIGAIGLSGTITSPKVAGFELSISDIQPFNDNSGAGLSFVAGVKLSTMFAGDAGLRLYCDYSKWKYDRVALDKVNIEFNSKAFSIKGGVEFKNGDAIYGSGFRGDLDLNVIEKFDLQAVGVFGKVNGYRYFLTDVYLELPPASGILVPPALSFYGFGGGLYSKMQQTIDPTIDSDFGKALSGINYIPDKNVGFGFMATTKFGLSASSKAFNAKVGFEIQFNNYGGLNFIQFRGDASFMNTAEAWGKMADNINDKVKKMENLGGEIEPAKKEDLKKPENKESGFLTASLNVKLDFANDEFSADLSVYLNAGIIKGVGPNDRMGWASAYFSPDKWYTYIGTPTDRFGIEVLGLVTLDGYFMIGDDIPELPSPPQKVLQNFSPSVVARLTTRDSDELTSGSGIAFGLSLSVEFNATLTPFYANIGIGLGSEFLLKNYGSGAYCAGGSGTLGINGWYARAQVWSWVEADIGMQAKIFGKKKKFSILDISASALLAGEGPNPFYFTGAVGGRFSALGGLVSGQCDFDFEIGEKCKIMGGSPFGEDIISQLTPSDGEKDVNVFTAPQAIFTIPIDLAMEVEEDEGKKAWYKIKLVKFGAKYKDTDEEITGFLDISQEGKLYVLDPDEPFESQRDVVVYAAVGFLRKLNGKWTAVTGSDGKPLLEIKSQTFKTGDRPKEILPEHIKYSYPIARQYNYYSGEYNKGYFQVSENYSYLFTTDKPEGFNQGIKVTDSNGQSQQTSFTYKTYSGGNAIRLEVNFSTAGITFAKNEIYKLALVNTPKNANASTSSNITTTTTNLDNNEDIDVTTSEAEGILVLSNDKEICALDFRVSKYNTLKEKMAKHNLKTSGWIYQITYSMHDIKGNVIDDEFFDINEIKQNNDRVELIHFKAELASTSWYKNSIYKDMYSKLSFSVIETARLNTTANENNIQYPPVNALKIRNDVTDKQLSDDEITSGIPSGTNPGGNITYSIPYWSSIDLSLHKNAIASKIANGKSISTLETKVVNTVYAPRITKSVYPVEISYVLPGKNITTSRINVEMYCPINLQ